MEWAFVDEVGQVSCPRCLETRFVVLNQVAREKENRVLCYACCTRCGHEFVFAKDFKGKVLRRT